MTNNTTDSNGIIMRLGELPNGAIVDEEAIAEIFGRCSVSVKRAVDRGELPVPIRLFGKPCWTAGKIISYLEERLRVAELKAKDESERLERNSPR